MTSTGRDPISLLSRALDQTGSIIARVRPEQATLVTVPVLGRGRGDRPVHRPRPRGRAARPRRGRENLKPQFRGDEAGGHAFGPEIPVADDAPL